MNRLSNPFHEQFVSETIVPEDFVQLFSPVLLEKTQSLFMPGNIVLKGVRGAGKSMLLGLMKPATRIAYERAKQPFPLPEDLQNFLGAGINLTRSGFSMFGQRSFGHAGSVESEKLLPFFAADFFNYWVVADILRSIETLTNECDGRVGARLKMSAEASRLNAFAASLAGDDCWYGYLDGIQSWSDLLKKLGGRISAYRSYLNFNSDQIGKEVSESKSNIGVPISTTVKLLKDYGVCSESTEVLIRIDQYEELFHLDGSFRQLGLQSNLRSAINGVLAARDPNVSYRVGTRGYAWREGIDLQKTTAKLEEGRNYLLIDLDDMLQRHENAGGWIFPKFAEDVFSRRLVYAGYSRPLNPLQHVLGTGDKPKEKARKYGGETPEGRMRAVRVDPTWPKQWQEFLKSLAKKDPLSAKFGEAWARQKGKSHDLLRTIPTSPYPWESKDSSVGVWRGERYQHALIQIAGSCSQRVIYSGRREVIGLSGANISVFLSICGHIWSVWLASQREEIADGQSLKDLPPKISTELQSVGVLHASSRNFENILQDGKPAYNFVSYVGRMLNRKLYEDRALSNPGHHGFSLSLEELNTNDVVSGMLGALTDQGHLQAYKHSTKNKDRKPRQKWYLNPILAPLFDLPFVRKKEPYYATVRQVEEWVNGANNAVPPKELSELPTQRLLFDD
ncbi:MAG: hypothetical protein RIB43_09705 [Rhodospirillaceae bacterium]